VLIVYPNAWRYHEVDEAKVDSILDALEQGAAVEELLMA
jgi:(2Fe-2S) ferredoxin